jgi:FkbM family methyltransferase
VFDVLDVDCVIDVGANEGQYARMLREREEVGFRGRIASVEPAREPYARLLEASARDPEWVTFNFGLGDTEEKSMLRIFSTDNFSSLHPINDYGAERFGQTEVGKEEITVRRLDVVFDELVTGCERVFLKCDTQGHDLAVLKGLGSKKVLGLQVELSLINIYDRTPGFTEAIETVERLGFAPSGFFPITRSADRLRLIEMDGVFIARS